jgi:hypothetical protein
MLKQYLERQNFPHSRVCALQLMTSGFSRNKDSMVGLSYGFWDLENPNMEEPEIDEVFLLQARHLSKKVQDINRLDTGTLHTLVTEAELIRLLNERLLEDDPDVLITSAWFKFTRPWLQHAGLLGMLELPSLILDLGKLDAVMRDLMSETFVMPSDLSEWLNEHSRGTSIKEMVGKWLGAESSARPLSRARVEDFLYIYTEMLHHGEKA